ncbi:hypothetical protein [Lawsonibacter sp. JLR.KK007]|uniref:hypothetical protein n=1 Tax=Lawsonibacter sp. JLR.KK007 TaxID=3114293 RepID=UPI002FF1FCE3
MESGKTLNSSVQRIVKLEKLYQDGLVIEEPKELEHSLMLPEYRRAAVMVSEIVQRAEQLKEPYDGTAVNNIISFVGKRGTGKTSVMRSFKEFLKNTKSGGDVSLFQAGETWDLPDETCFVTLRYIDTSILKSSEDVMIIVLTRMFQYVRKLLETPSCYGLPATDQEETRSLFRKFEQVYESIMTLNEKRTFHEGESALQCLQSVNSSFSLADNFRCLVKEFLKFVADKGQRNHRRPYLVVALDDVDRYMPDIQKGELQKDVYTLLGQIDEYMKIPGVIVLLSYDEVLLRDNCQKHIEQKFLMDRYSARANEQVLQYLEKIIPSQQKIYMPNLSRVDYDDSAQLRVEVAPELKLTVKQLTLGYLASQYGCFFDGLGDKEHFFEERNLRSLSKLMLVLRLSDREKKLGQGYQKLSNYIYNRLNNFVLNTEEAVQFSKWLEEPIDRTSRDIIEYVQAEMKGGLFFARSQPSENWGSSYGELMYNLYRASHTETPGEQILSEKMVQSVLLSYSITLPQLVQRGDRELIKKILGSSIAGQWANDVLPTFFVNQNNTKMTGRGRVGAYNIKNGFDSIFHFSYTKTAEAGKFELRDFIQAVELLGMFFTTVQKDGFPSHLSLALEIRKPDWDWNSDIEFVLGSQADSACFNLFNFVVNAYNWEEYFEQLHKSLAGVVESRISEEAAYTNASVDQLSLVVNEKKPDGLALLRKYSLKNQFKKWSENFGDLAMPIQHFDMMYNILRRQQDDRNHGLRAEANPSEYLDSCRIVYQNILDELYAQDEFYNKSRWGDEPFASFGDTFLNCPFIFYTLVKKKTHVTELLKDWTGQLVNQLLVPMADDSFLKPNG